MPVVRFDAICSLRASAAICLCAITLVTTLFAQSGSRNGVGSGGPSGLGDRLRGPEKVTPRQFYRENGPVISQPNSLPVTEVLIVGSETYSDSQVREHIRTRPGRPYDTEQIQSDVRRLMSSGMFHNVRPFVDQDQQGVSVTFQVFERPTIRAIKYLGNEKIKDRVLKRESGLSVGESLNLYTVDEAQRKLERFYREKGFPKANVQVVEGNRPEDRQIVFVINEGRLQRVLKTEFVGNQFVNERRLNTKIESKRGYLWFIKGRFDRAKLDADVEKLTAYYRSFGFFRAHIGREYRVGGSGAWVSIKFVVDEGPRYVVRSVAFKGVNKFAHKDLSERLEMQQGDYFHIGELNKDIAKLKDFYGHYGYIFADIQADPRFLEEPGQLDLIFDVKEGELVRVRNINVQIAGDNPHTSKETVWPRIDLQPGDILSSRKVRNAERRLKAAQIFKVDPASGAVPRVVVRPVEEDDLMPDYDVRGQSPSPFFGAKPRRPSTVRGQNPSPYGAQPYIPRNVAQSPGAYAGIQPGAPAVGNYPQYPQTAGSPNSATPGSSDHRRYGLPASGQQLQPAQYQAPSTMAVAAQPTQPYVSPNQNYGNQNFSNPTYGANNQVRLQPTQQVLPQNPNYGPPNQNYFPNNQVPVGPPANTLTPPNQGVGPPGNGIPFAPPPAPGYQPGAVYQSAPTNPNGPFLQSLPPPGYPALQPQSPPLTLPSLGPNPYMLADVDVMLEETQTGRFMFGVGVNSDAGVIGNIVVDERNFDLFRFPRTWQDFASGRAFRGGGQGFRLEALPGTRVQRYSASLTEPYLFGTQVSSNVSGYYFDRRFFDWDEQRFGGRLGFGYRLGPDLSVGLNARAEQVQISNPRTIGATPQLDRVVGQHDVYSGRVSLTHDTRDVAFAPTEGHLIELSYEQVFGSFDYPRGNIDYRQYFLVHQRPDFSGRHTVGFSFRVGASGSDTPIFENFFAGGFSTLRGFDFRGASPVVNNVIVGGQFQFLGSVEYLFPITADDMMRGVVFVDYGTVEQDIEINADNYRIAPGFGLRIFVPAMGPAPIALDFAFPIADAMGDQRQVFSFFIGLNR